MADRTFLGHPFAMEGATVRTVRGRAVEGALLLISAAFVFAGAAALSLALDGELQWQHFYYPLVWLLLYGGVFFALGRLIPGHDPYIVPVVALMTGWGLILIDRLAPNFLPRQTAWLAISCFTMTLVAVYRPIIGFLKRYRYTWLTAGLLLLAATLVFGVNPSGQGATLWLSVPFASRIYFQPSELLKLLLVVFLASYFADRRRMVSVNAGSSSRRWIAYLTPLVMMWGFCMVLLIWQRDLGAATLFLAVFIVLLYLSTGDWRYVAGGLIMMLAAGIIGYMAYDVVALRVDTWLNPWIEADSRGFQIVQSLYAVAAGGMLGEGAGQGFPGYIPVVHSDFAFAALAEEWGLIGALAVVAGILVIVHRGLHIASRSNDAFGFYLASGIAVLLGAQSFLIMAGVTKLLPLTGVTLPFVSYGGSSLLVSCIMIGLLLSLSAGRIDPEGLKGDSN